MIHDYVCVINFLIIIVIIIMVCADRAYMTTDSELSLLQKFNEIIHANQQLTASASSVNELFILEVNK